jgi:hypothetical protein
MLDTTLIYAGLIPLVVAGVVMLVARAWTHSNAAAWATSVTSGFLAGEIGLKCHANLAAGIRTLTHPVEAADWLPLIAILALAATLAILFAPVMYRRFGVVLAGLLVVAVSLRLVSGHVYLTHEWSAVQKIVCLAILVSVIGGYWLLMAADTMSNELTSFSRVFFVGLVTAGTAIVVAESGAFAYGQSCGALASSLAGGVIASFISGFSGSNHRGKFLGFTGAGGVIACTLVSLIVLTWLFATLTSVHAALLLIALAAAGAPLPPFLASQPAWLAVSMRALASLTPLALAIANTLSSVTTNSPY